MTKSASFFQKYWFARGFSDRVCDLDKEPPAIEMVEYVMELTGFDILKEYEFGYEQAEKDKVNNVI